MKLRKSRMYIAMAIGALIMYMESEQKKKKTRVAMEPDIADEIVDYPPEHGWPEGQGPIGGKDTVRINIKPSKVFSKDDTILHDGIRITVRDVQRIPSDAGTQTISTPEHLKIFLTVTNEGSKLYHYTRSQFQQVGYEAEGFPSIEEKDNPNEKYYLKDGESLDDVVTYEIKKDTEKFTLFFMKPGSDVIGIEIL